MARTYCSFRVRVTFQSQFNTSQILYPKQFQPVHSVSIEIEIGTLLEDSDDDEPIFGPDAKMRRLLKFEIELMQCFDLWVGTERLKLTCSWMELSQML